MTRETLMAAQNRTAIMAEGLLYDGKFVESVNTMKDKIVRNYVKNYKVIGECFAKVSNPIGDSVIIENLRYENQNRKQNYMGVKTKMDYADFKSIKTFRKVLVECAKVAKMKNHKKREIKEQKIRISGKLRDLAKIEDR